MMAGGQFHGVNIGHRVRGQMANDRGQRTEGRRQRTEDRRFKFLVPGSKFQV
jgi:hypothetical protein